MTIVGALVAALRCADVARDDVHVSLFAAIVQYAEALGRVVLANDVEDVAHVERLREIGCDFGSGPAFGPPLRPEEIAAFRVSGYDGRDRTRCPRGRGAPRCVPHPGGKSSS